MSKSITGFKVLTSDLRPPVQGGDPYWTNGSSLPLQLGPVKLNKSSDECAAGINFTRELVTALRIGGFWPMGRPSRAFLVETPSDAEWVERGDKCRADKLVVLREASNGEIEDAIRAFSAKYFGAHADYMAVEQMAWREALARPSFNAATVEAGLTRAFEARGLDWQLKKFDSARDAWAAWAAWDVRAARAARDAWAARAARAAWDVRDARAAWDVRDAWDAWAARDAWAAWDVRAARDAWAARAAWDVRDALTVSFAAINKWTSHDPHLLTTGLREAYANGLAIAVPTGPKELGWAMVEQETEATP